jgi:signal transduction histidine kinase
VARLRAFGLRSRIVGVVLVTAVATLAVAAAALLGPLEHQLKQATLNTLVADLRKRDATAGFTRLHLQYVLEPAGTAGSPAGARPRSVAFLQRAALQQQEQTLRAALGATVTLFGYPDASGIAQRVPTTEPPSEGESFTSDVRRAFLTQRLVEGFGSEEGTPEARVAIPLTIQAHPYVLAVRRPITEVAGAVGVVRTAFLEAAGAGLLLTLLLGIPLSGRLVRRLRRLREAAVRLPQEGLEVDVPADRTRDEVGDLARTLGVMQRNLRHQEEARRSFVATASHELRTPLTSLEGMLELLDDELHVAHPDLADAQELLARARAQSRRLGHLAADLLDLSRIDAQVKLRSEPIELAELCRAVLAEFERRGVERQVALRLVDPQRPVWALGDPGSVARILRILLDNALRVSPPASEITISLTADAGAQLSVADQGPGVSADERELIFQRFHRGRATGGEAGFGLGLAIGRELAERMEGSLVLASSDEGGARFTLHLPLCEEGGTAAPARMPLDSGLRA